MSSLWKWTIDQGGQRADRGILDALQSNRGSWETLTPEGAHPSSFSRNQIQNLIADGKVTIDGQPIKANAKLCAGSVARIEFSPPKAMEIIPENRPLEILFEDRHLLVVNKPPGLTVHPSPTQMEGTLVHVLLHHISDLSGIGGVLRPGIVHRLDKDTSGALVISKTDEAHHKLVSTFSAHAIERRYWALCYGFPSAVSSSKELKIDSLIGRNPTDRKKMSMHVKTGRQAITHVRMLEQYGRFASLLEARLETGRTHQVRVHLTGLGHSLIGDSTYGVPTERHAKWLALPAEIREAASRLPGQALHARVLGFKHPITGEMLRFEAPLPEAFHLLLEALRRYL